MGLWCSPQVPVMRSTRVLSFLDSRIALSNRQIALSVYGLTNYGYWKARTDTKKLFDAGLVKRGKVMGGKDFVYYIGKKPDDLDHLILANWVWVKLLLTEKLSYFENEKPLPGIQPDAYFVYDGKPYFLEVNREARHEFEKVPLYTDYFNSTAWKNPEWPGGMRFAVILVVTDTEQVKRYVLGRIEKENSAGLRFRVATLKEFWESPEVYLKWD